LFRRAFSNIEELFVDRLDPHQRDHQRDRPVRSSATEGSIFQADGLESFGPF